jgi:exopolysaccharide production protein ExoZ
MGKRLYSIQVVRAVAATLVVISHIGRALLLRAGTDVTSVTTLGGAGVDLFFVVSGFIMVQTTTWPFHAQQFMRQRLTRIAPLYWLATLLYAAIALMLPGLFHFYHFDLHNFLTAFVFLPSYSAAGDILPPLEQGWTLVYEMFFYVMFAIASKIAFTRRIRLLGVIFFLLVGAGLVLQPTQNALALTYTNPILFEFLAGCVLADLIGRGRLQIGVGGAVALIGVAIVGVAVSPALMQTACPRVIYWGVPALLAVSGCIGLEHVVAFERTRAIQAIGDGSYSIYLSHVVVLSVLSLAFRLEAARWHGGLPLAPVFLAVCLLVGWLSYRLVERPLTVFIRRVVGERPASRMPASVARTSRGGREATGSTPMASPDQI